MLKLLRRKNKDESARRLSLLRFLNQHCSNWFSPKWNSKSTQLSLWLKQGLRLRRKSGTARKVWWIGWANTGQVVACKDELCRKGHANFTMTCSWCLDHALRVGQQQVNSLLLQSILTELFCLVIYKMERLA